MNNEFCYNCMREIEYSKICPDCDNNAMKIPESQLYLSPGTVLQEKYLIGKALGQGGFGITYLAWDTTLNIKLAIKEYLPQELAYRTVGQSDINLLKESLAGSFNYGLEKFLEEARTLAQFNEHPNIVSVRDFFKANGTAYLVMNHIEGVTLKEYLTNRDKLLPFEQASYIFMPVLDALKEVHAAGILHRDISPDNLLLDAKGRVVLIDFGAARQAMGDKSRSMSVIMKAGFTPLEQYQSKGKQGPWTDIYAVAATFYHAITGQFPPESMDRIDEDNLVPPLQLGTKMTSEQEKALLKALAVRARDRFQTVEEFQEALMKMEVKEFESPASNTSNDRFNIEKENAFLTLEEEIGSKNYKKSNQGLFANKSENKEKKALSIGYAILAFLFLLTSAITVSISFFGFYVIIIPIVALVLLILVLLIIYSIANRIFGSVRGKRDKRTQDKIFNTSKKSLSGTEAVIIVIGILAAFGVVLFILFNVFSGEMLTTSGSINKVEVNAQEDVFGSNDAFTDADYVIDYEHGTIPLSEVEIGARVADPTWEWEFRQGRYYTSEDGDETKPVTWLVVAKDHYDGLEPHVTLLSEELIGRFVFDNSTDREHYYSYMGSNHWGNSGTTNATRGLRPWLNSNDNHADKGFYRAFTDNFKNVVLITSLPNKEWQKKEAYITSDFVFIPSDTELGDNEHGLGYPIGSVYKYFKESDDEKRVAKLAGEPHTYWTRTPGSRSFGTRVLCVNIDGAYGNDGAGVDIRGVRPALNVKSDTLVTKVRN